MRKAWFAGLMMSSLVFAQTPSIQAVPPTHMTPRFPENAVSGTFSGFAPQGLVIDGTTYGISPSLVVFGQGNLFETWGTLRPGDRLKWLADTQGRPVKIWKIKDGEPDWGR